MLVRRFVRPFLQVLDDDPLLLCDCDEQSGHTCA